MTAFFTINLSSLIFAENYNVGVESIGYLPVYAKRDGEYSGYARAVF